MRRITFLSILLTAVLIIVGCSLLMNTGDTVDVTIQLAMPDYSNHVFPNSRTLGSSYTRVLDPGTTNVNINVSGTGIVTSDYTFDFSNAERTEDGIWVLSCVIPSVRVGAARIFSAATTDASGTPLTSGSATADIYAIGPNIVRIPLIPNTAVALTIGNTHSDTVEYGSMAHFSISPTVAGTLTIELTSDQDVDLLMFDSNGIMMPNQVWQVGAPTAETATLTVPAATTYYLSVYGNTPDITNDFIFNPTQVDEAGEPVLGLILMGGAIQGNDLGLTPTTADVSTIAGVAGNFGFNDAVGSAAQFWFPAGITTDGTYLYLADAVNDRVRKVDIATVNVTTLLDVTTILSADYYQAGVTTDGTWVYLSTHDQVTPPFDGEVVRIHPTTGAATALGCVGLEGSTGITTDNVDLFVADTYNHRIVRVNSTTGAVTHLAGSTTALSGYVNGPATTARFNDPMGITTDGTYLYVTERNNHTVRRVTIADGTVAAVAGDPGVAGSDDGTGTAARFDNPKEITCDGTNLYVGDSFNDNIRKIVIATGEVTTIAGLSGSFGSTDGTGTAARFYYPWGVTTDGVSLFVDDMDNHIIRKIE